MGGRREEGKKVSGRLLSICQAEHVPNNTGQRKEGEGENEGREINRREREELELEREKRRVGD